MRPGTERQLAARKAADVTSFRAALLAPHVRRHGRARASAPSESTTPGTGLFTRSPKTVKHIIGTLRCILDTAVDDQAIPSNPVVAGRRHTTKRRTSPDDRQPFKHRPLTANQVAAVVDWIATDHEVVRQVANSSGPKGSTYTRQGNLVYALAVLFAAYTGVRASELQGLQLQDVTLSDIPGTVGAIRVTRTAMRKGHQWHYGTPKSDASTDRVVPLAPWLADEMREYLTQIHPSSAINAAGNKHIPHAPLFPGQRNR